MKTPSSHPPFNVVLFAPEIPNNTGAIGRTCAATGCRLHLIHPLGFDIDEKARRRAGLDYWELLDCAEHESWDAFLAEESPERIWLYTTKTSRPYWDAQFKPGDYLLFGRETSGVPDTVRDDVIARGDSTSLLTLPMIDDPRARSLNLANTATVAIYEGLRQCASNPGARL